MRVLFFLEPFPVRRQPLDFLWVADRWHRTAQDLAKLGVEVGWAASDEVARARPDLSALSPQSLGFDLPIVVSDAESDAGWAELMRNPSHPTWHAVVSAMLDAQRPDAVISWTVNAPLRSECEHRNIVLMHQELGPLRAPLVPLFFADPRGVNGASSVQAVWPALCAEPWTARHEAELATYLRRCYPVPEVNTEVRRALGLDAHRRVVVLFGQVPRDSNILAWSRVDSFGLVSAIRDAADPARFQVVVKRHPAVPSDPLPEGIVVAPPTLSARALVAAADAVATINSSTALEGLLQARPVYLFGDGPFSGVGATRDVSGEVAPLAARLREDPAALSPSEDLARRRLLHFLLLRYFRSDDELADAHSLLETLETWRVLQARRAPLIEWFPSSRVATRLREDHIIARSQATVAELCTARAACEKQAGVVARLQDDLANATRLASAAEVEARRVIDDQQHTLAELHRTIEQSRLAEAEAQRVIEAHLRALAEKDDLLRGEATEVTRLRSELQDLEASTGLRVVHALKQIPGVYRAYLAAKRVAGHQS
jgi:hypothetical protein